jgi:16S rRNA (adenine1518-N6/adenine1519-N6)-dimethyltransferase
MIRPKKSLGQHFLKDDNIARKIAGYLDPAIPAVLEIGPGTGVLTKHILADPAFDLQVIEIDRESVGYLASHFPALKGRIIYGDFLDLQLSGILRPVSLPGWQAGGIQIIGNFPYNISSQILFRVLENRDLVLQVTGMFQKEVAERIASPPGSKQYGILSVLMQAFYTIEYLLTVNESVFFPPPKVKSSVIRFKRNTVKNLGCDERLFFRVVKTAFNQRRKTIRNSIRGLATSKPDAESLLLDLRPEQLSVGQFEELTRWVDKHSGNNT